MNIMLNLDKRCQEILKRLMYAGGYLKIQDLADEMQISRRSVYYDITKSMNGWRIRKSIRLFRNAARVFLSAVSSPEGYRRQ